MANITLIIPDPFLADVAASVRAHYGEAADRLTDAEACKHAAKAHLRELYRARKKRTASSAAVAAAEAALTAKEAAAVAAVQARKDAEEAALTAADTDFAGVV